MPSFDTVREPLTPSIRVTVAGEGNGGGKTGHETLSDSTIASCIDLT